MKKSAAKEDLEVSAIQIILAGANETLPKRKMAGARFR
jgi:hypothetical protein